MKNQMRPLSRLAFLLATVFVSALCASGCGRVAPRVAPIDTDWTAPKVLDSELGCRSDLQARKFNNRAVAFDLEDHALYTLGDDGLNWDKKAVPAFNGYHLAYADATTNEIVLVKSDVLPPRNQAYQARNFSQDRVDGEIVVASLDNDFGLQTVAREKVALTRGDLFGTEATSLGVYEFGFGSALVRGSQIDVPYVAQADVSFANEARKEGSPAVIGVYESQDGGSSWTRTHLFDLRGYTALPGLFASRGTQFLLVNHAPDLVYTERSGSDAPWPALQTLVAHYWYSVCAPVGDEDTFHFCWLENPATELRLKDQVPFFGESLDYQLFYRNWKDSTATWSEARKLSAGLKPRSISTSGLSMSVEGQRIVVAWVHHAGKGRDARYDIAYSVSADGGQHWSEPRQVTSTTPGRAAHSPQVVLLRGVIHLFYHHDREHAAGNCWDILYQQRRFPGA
ncbi:MAG: sialidase family protein [Verrucomicrobiia bacterium]|jgi:hypothetical protein